MTRSAAAILALLLAAAPARSDEATPPEVQQDAAEDSMLGMLTMKPGADMSEADRGYMKAMQAMQQALMKTEMSGAAGGDFARVMILHHHSAIGMIDVLLAQTGVDPAMRDLAEKMRAAQAADVVALQAWLAANPR